MRTCHSGEQLVSEGAHDVESKPSVVVFLDELVQAATKLLETQTHVLSATQHRTPSRKAAVRKEGKT